MNSVSLVMADRDEVFLNKVSKGILDRKLGYQVAIFTEMEPLLSYLEDEEVGMLIIDSSLFKPEVLKKVKAKVKILMIEQKNISAPGFYKVKKFQKPSNFIETINNIYINNDKYVEDRQKVKDVEPNELEKPIASNSFENLETINDIEIAIPAENNPIEETTLDVVPIEKEYPDLEFADELDDLKILEENIDEVLKRVNIDYVDEEDANLETVKWVDIDDFKDRRTMPLNTEDRDMFYEMDRRRKEEVEEVKIEKNSNTDFLDDFEIWSRQEKERMEKENQPEQFENQMEKENQSELFEEESEKQFDNNHSFDINNYDNNLNVGENFNKEIFEKKPEYELESLSGNSLDDNESWDEEQKELELKHKLENMHEKSNEDIFESPSFKEEWDNNYEPEEDVVFEMEEDSLANTIESPVYNFEPEYEFEEEPKFEVLNTKKDNEPLTNISNEEMDFGYEEKQDDFEPLEIGFGYEEEQVDETPNNIFEYDNDNLSTEDFKHEEENNNNLIEDEVVIMESVENEKLETINKEEDFNKWLDTEDDIFEEYRAKANKVDENIKRKSLEFLEEIEEDYEEWDYESKKWKEEFNSQTIEDIETLPTKDKYDQDDFERWSMKQKINDPDKFGGTFKSSTEISFDDDEVFEMGNNKPEEVFSLADGKLDFGMELKELSLASELYHAPAIEDVEEESKSVEVLGDIDMIKRFREWEERESKESKSPEIEKTISNTIGFYSPAGGNGNSTIALTFAAMMAREGSNVFYLNLEKYNGTSVYLSKRKNILVSDFEFILNQDSLIDTEKLSILTDIDEKTNISFLPVDFVEGQMNENIFSYLKLIKKSNVYNYIVIDIDISLEIKKDILEQLDTEIVVISEGVLSIKKAEKYLLDKDGDYKIILNMKNDITSNINNDNLDLICEIPYMANIKDEKDLSKITDQFTIYIEAIKSVLEK